LALVAGVTVGIAAFTMVAFAAAAVSAQSVSGTTMVSITPHAQLFRSPTPGANVTVTYSCFPTMTGGKGHDFGQVTLLDTYGTFGSGYWVATCDEAKHTVVVLVQPQFPPTAPFVAGGAAATARVFGAGFATATRKIHLS
jgi:hypothetical protein